ncbi:TSUP family transporter [candidate division WWE3 bacterium]|nr:TSUP family transporter [candidate division WWE3 bacterium]
MSILQVLLLFGVGLVIGLYDAVVGSGGLALMGVLSISGLPPHVAIGTMRLLSLVQEGVALVAFLKRKLIDVKLSLLLGGLASLASGLGAILVFRVSDTTLTPMIAVLMLLLAFAIPILHSKTKTFRSIYVLRSVYKNLIDESAIETIPQKRIILLMGIFILLGLYGGFYGAGFGTFSLIAFTTIGGMKLLRGAGNSRLVGFLMSLAATGIFLSKGAIAWNFFFPLGLGTVLGSWYGVALADKLGSKYMKILLTLVVVATAIKLLLDVV